MYIKIGSVQAGGRNDEPLNIENFTAPTTDLRENLVDRPNGDGSMIGKTYLGNSSWGFDITTNMSNLQEAVAEANKLEREWKKEFSRLTSNRPQALLYSLTGERWFKVWGRCGKFTGITPDVLATKGVGKITADFTQTHIPHYSATDSSATINFVAPISGGITSPITAPITTSGSGGESARFVDNDGDLPTELKITFHGPISNPALRSGQGWEVSYRGSISEGDYVTIDPLMGTVKAKNGSSRAGNLGTKVRLSKVKLPPGQSELFLQGSDSTALSKVVVTWNSAYTGLQA